MDVTCEHRVLVVDDEVKIGNAITRILKRHHILSDFVTDGEQALAKLARAEDPYALVISDQRMPGMKGHELLAAVARKAPETIRFLMSAYTDLEAVIDAVNLGEINQFIPKPFDNEKFIDAVEKGIEQFELDFESERLFMLAQTQNHQLLELYEKLKTEKETYEKKMTVFTGQIQKARAKITALKNTDIAYAAAQERIEDLMKEQNLLDQNGFDRFAACLKQELGIQFRDIAVRNGLKMTELYPWKP